MGDALIKFTGQFQVWAYTVSHSQLLLRSTKSPSRQSQVDVLFKNVAALQTPTLFDDLAIFEAPYLRGHGPNRIASRSGDDLRLYTLRGRDYEGYVVAGIVIWNEGDHEYDEPSPLLVPSA